MKNNNKLKKYIKMAIILIGGCGLICALAAYFALKTPTPITKKNFRNEKTAFTSKAAHVLCHMEKSLKYNGATNGA